MEPDVETGEIRRAFRVLAKRHHPDAGGDEELFKQIGIAFYVLSDPQSREEYDKLMHFREESPKDILREGTVSDYMAPYSGTMESCGMRFSERKSSRSVMPGKESRRSGGKGGRTQKTSGRMDTERMQRTERMI